jgi:hypothetical protein
VHSFLHTPSTRIIISHFCGFSTFSCDISADLGIRHRVSTGNCGLNRAPRAAIARIEVAAVKRFYDRHDRARYCRQIANGDAASSRLEYFLLAATASAVRFAVMGIPWETIP